MTKDNEILSHEEFSTKVEDVAASLKEQCLSSPRCMYKDKPDSYWIGRALSMPNYLSNLKETQKKTK